MRLFDQIFDPSFEKLVTAVHRVAESGGATESAIAQNLILDYRVSVHRAKQFRDWFLEELEAQDDESLTSLGTAIVDALKRSRKRAGTHPAETFLHPSNADNFVPESLRPSRFRTTWNVSRFLTLPSIGPDEIRHLPWRDPSNPPVSFPDLKSATLALEELLEYTLPIESPIQALLSLRDLLPQFHPNWCLDANEARPVQEAGIPGSWYFPLGMDQSLDLRGQPIPIYLLVLEYELPETIRLVCPTQLDSGANPLHFPTPRCLPQHEGGCTLRLDEIDDGKPVWLREFIHEQVSFQLPNWEMGGRLAGTLRTDPRGTELFECCFQHWWRFATRFPFELGDWGAFFRGHLQ